MTKYSMIIVAILCFGFVTTEKVKHLTLNDFNRHLNNAKTIIVKSEKVSALKIIPEDEGLLMNVGIYPKGYQRHQYANRFDTALVYSHADRNTNKDHLLDISSLKKGEYVVQAQLCYEFNYLRLKIK